MSHGVCGGSYRKPSWKIIGFRVRLETETYPLRCNQGDRVPVNPHKTSEGSCRSAGTPEHLTSPYLVLFSEYIKTHHLGRKPKSQGMTSCWYQPACPVAYEMAHSDLLAGLQSPRRTLSR